MKGRPDWTNSVNITGQDLAEVISRPKYGSVQIAAYLDDIAEDVVETVVSIAGTGMIYGGFIVHEGAFNPIAIAIAPYIDNITLTYLSMDWIHDYQIEDKNMWFFFNQYYSEANDKYIQGISGGITFETSYAIRIWNEAGSGASDTITLYIYYALI